MTDVLIKRELLERANSLLCSYSSTLTDRAVTRRAISEICAILAAPRQPEGEGLEVVDKIGTFEIPDIVATFDGLYLIPVKPLNAGDHLMAISQHRRMWQDAQRAIAELREEISDLHRKLDKFYNQSHGIPALAEIERLRAERDTLRQQLVELRDMLSCEVETNIPLRQKAFDLTEQRDKLAEILRDIVPGCKWKHMRPRIDAALAEIDHDNE